MELKRHKSIVEANFIKHENHRPLHAPTKSSLLCTGEADDKEQSNHSRLLYMRPVWGRRGNSLTHLRSLRFSRQFWMAAGITPNICSAQDMPVLQSPTGIPARHFQVFFLPCFCMPASVPASLRKCIEDSTLWAEIFNRRDRIVVLAWKLILCSPYSLLHGMEYGFGAHEYPTSGVFQVEPKSCPGFIFRRSVCVGSTNMSRSEVRSFLEDLAEDYHGDTYHLIAKNCNHFTADICKRLTGKPIPGWVNRLARLGSLCNCVLPESIKVSAVRDVNALPEFPDDDLESNASIVDGSDADDLDHLITTPSSDVVSSKDKILTPGRDSL